MPRVTVEGRELELSNLDKVLYPAAGFTKGEVIAYYRRIAPAILPHLSGRPLTLKRYPNGVAEKFFYEKRCPGHRPPWVETAEIFSGRAAGTIPYCVAADLPTLVWVANLASLELHTSLSRAPEIDRPTMVVFDLDPGPGTSVVECSQVALLLREAFEHLGLTSVAKTSGSKGMQLYVPLNTPVGYEGPGGTKAFALALARLLERQHPEAVTSEMKKELRPGKVFIDWSQNDQHKTTVCVYSLRAREQPTVSTPVTWDEVEACAAGAADLVFLADAACERYEAHGDLFAVLGEVEQELPRL